MDRREVLWLDSDVLLDHLASRTPWNGAALELFSRAARNEIGLWVSPLILANVFYVLRKIAGSEAAILEIRAISALLGIAGMGRDEVIRALGTGRLDFEDELQIATASNIEGLSAIITRNARDYAGAGIRVLSAETWLSENPPAPEAESGAGARRD